MGSVHQLSYLRMTVMVMIERRDLLLFSLVGVSASASASTSASANVNVVCSVIDSLLLFQASDDNNTNFDAIDIASGAFLGSASLDINGSTLGSESNSQTFRSIGSC